MWAIALWRVEINFLIFSNACSAVMDEKSRPSLINDLPSDAWSWAGRALTIWSTFPVEATVEKKSWWEMEPLRRREFIDSMMEKTSI